MLSRKALNGFGPLRCRDLDGIITILKRIIYEWCELELYGTRLSSNGVFSDRTFISLGTADGGTVVKVLCYKSEGRWFDSRWCNWNFSLT
jgi:hypothetical protein